MIGIDSVVGNYKVKKKLGQGAMGSVFLAEHPVIGKRVALKVIHADLAENEEMVSRFFNEARAVTQIGHQHIIEVIDFGQSPDGDNFIVMELLEGKSLGDVLKETPILPVPRALHIARQIAEGLEASHQRGIIHRDLKPDNIYLIERLGDADFVKILDFGLAKLTQGGGAMSHKTRAGSVLGTPHYMAPEQCEGKPDIDHRVDVYALGCLLYQMLCGRVPFPGEGFGEVLVKHLREPPALPTKLNPSIPRPIEAIILNALAKRKEFRFQSMKKMAEAIADPDRYVREVSGEGSLQPPTSEMPAPTLPSSKPTPTPRPSGPVLKAGGEQATVLAELPADVMAQVNAARAQAPHGYVPPPAPAPAPVGHSTMVLEAASIPMAPHVPGQIAPTPPPAAISHTGATAAVKPVSDRSRLGPKIAIAAGLLVVVGAGGAAALHFAHKPAAAPVVPAGPKVVSIDTTPSGADVFRDGSSIGTTPVTLRFAQSDAPAALRFHLEGYSDVQRSVSYADAGQVMVRLREVPPDAVKPAAPPPTPAAAAPKAEAAPKPAPSVKMEPSVARPAKPAPSVQAEAPHAAAPKPAAAPKAKKSKKQPHANDDILMPEF